MEIVFKNGDMANEKMSEIYTIMLTESQCELIKKAIDAYEYTTSDVMSYDEIQSRRKDVIIPIYNQLPESVF